MRRQGPGSDEAWGYLLPAQDGPTPLELRLDKETVGTLGGRTLLVDAASADAADASSPPAAAAPQLAFEVQRERYDECVAWLLVLADAVSVNGKALRKWQKQHLDHGDRVSLGGDGAGYVFVHQESSKSFRAPQDLRGKYLFGPSLGAGGFGKVYMLFDKKLGYQRRAMKIVQPRDEKQVQFAEREARILMTLKHPCVIETYSVKQMGRQTFLVMEYMAGGDLTQFVNKQRLLTEGQTKLLFFQLAVAVQYLHKKNICHRDLKPENILLKRRDPYSLIKVTDFGLAKDESSLKTIAGTQLYLAPEVFKDEKYTNSVDLWSMGVILFYSLTGTLPFRTIERALHVRHVVNFDPVRWRGVSFQAQIMVKSLLKPQATDRVSAARVLEDPWLQDDKMREDAFQLTGLEEIRPRPSSRPKATDTDPEQRNADLRSELNFLRRLLLIFVIILVGNIILKFL